MIRLGEVRNLLICQKSKIGDWVKHYKENYSKGCIAFDLTKPSEFDQFIFNTTELEQPFNVHVGIINYELAWRRKDLLKLRDFTLMLDESSLIQNKTAKQTKFVLKLNDQAKNVILLSGTPTAGKYENLWTQAHLLGWNISENLYQKQYVNWKKLPIGDGNFVKIVDKLHPYKNIERLKEKLREHGTQFLKTEEVMFLPEKTFISVNCESSKEYKKFMKDSIVVVDGVELVGDVILTKRLYARQLCGIYSEEKFESFADLLRSTNDRVVVFYNFDREYEKLLAVCEALERPVSVVNGCVKDLSNYESESSCVVLTQYQAGSMGLNLQRANKIVYFSPPERCELWMQSQKRIHRIGQNNPCFYYKMVCKGSIEESIYEALERGVDYTNELFKQEFQNF